MQERKINPAQLNFPRITKKYKRIEQEWAPLTQTYFGQGIKPHDPQLLPKLGIQQGEKVLVFAGYTGAWARALAAQCKVTFTDLTSEATNIAKTKHTPSKIKWLRKFQTPIGKYYSVHTIPAERAIQRPKVYDWSFSFEPIPLEKQNTLKLAIFRSLLNNKGCILTYRPIFDRVFEKDGLNKAVEKHVEHVANIYGARVVKIKNEKVHGTFILRKVQIIKVLTNDEAREKAWIDIRLWRILSRAEKNKKQLNSVQIAQSLNVPVEELENSLERLNQLDMLNAESVFESTVKRP
ncbi:MAG: hypothetical protein NTY48_06825 [Candidatus Diapherotrites archaeon]|nr:hypothetical protein [Candidatus Diapherotrites archaeon]